MRISVRGDLDILLLLFSFSYHVTLRLLHSAWRDFPRHRHGKLFIGRPCKERAHDLLKLCRHQLKMVVAILTGHAPVRGHLYTMGSFDGDPIYRFCRKESNSAAYYLLLRGFGSSTL